MALIDDPNFGKTVVPWLKNPAQSGDFVVFLRLTLQSPPATEKDRIDFLIGLGVLQNRPDWLTPKALTEIDEYYPGLRLKQTGDVTAVFRLASFELAQNAPAMPVSFFASQAMSGSTATYTAAVAPILRMLPAPEKIFAGLLTAAAIGILMAEQSPAGESADKKPSGASPQPQRADPGDCYPDQHAKLQAAVNRLCKLQRSCRPGMSIAQIDTVIKQNSACLAARAKIDSMCFQGGNIGSHKNNDILYDDIARTIDSCHVLLDNSRYNQPPPRTTYDYRQFFSGN